MFLLVSWLSSVIPIPRLKLYIPVLIETLKFFNATNTIKANLIERVDSFSKIVIKTSTFFMVLISTAVGSLLPGNATV